MPRDKWKNIFKVLEKKKNKTQERQQEKLSTYNTISNINIFQKRQQNFFRYRNAKQIYNK